MNKNKNRASFPFKTEPGTQALINQTAVKENKIKVIMFCFVYFLDW